MVEKKFGQDDKKKMPPQSQFGSVITVTNNGKNSNQIVDGIDFVFGHKIICSLFTFGWW